MLRSRAFTLIELLVVISIIGVLSSIVLASLNSARIKGQMSAIRSNLYNMIAAQELAYSNASPNAYPMTSTSISGMLTAIANVKGTAAYYSLDGSRWGTSARLNADSAKNWSVDSSGVVTWDTRGVNSAGTFVTPDVTMSWDTAMAACATAGGRLPTFEQLMALSLAYNSTTPPGFQDTDAYWSSTEFRPIPTRAYQVYMDSGMENHDVKTGSVYVRCVR